MSIPTVKDLLDAGVHFGHQTKRWDPKMKKYILTEKNGIYIIDLAKTIRGLKRAVEAVQRVKQSGAPILFVGTKRTIKECVREEAQRCGMFFVVERWLGGMLTNFSTVKQSIKKMEEIEKMEADGLFKEMAKKEVLGLNKHHDKLESVLGGIRNMRVLPGAIFVVDTQHEQIAVREAKRLNIPVIGIVDTNCDPDAITHPIPGNDDSIRSVGLITRVISDSIMGISSEKSPEEKKSSEEETQAVEAGKENK